MKLTKLSIERPLTVLMVILALVIMGVRGYSLLNVDRYPKINIPYVAVITAYPGAAATDIEDQIVKKIEDEVAGVAGLDKISSTAREGLAITQIQFLESVDPDRATSDVERAVSRVKGDLPSGAKEPTVIKADLQALPIMNVTLSGAQPLDELYRTASDDIKARLLAVEGVAAVQVSGGQQREVQVQADPIKMAAYKMSFTDLANALQAENVSVPVGAVTTEPSRLAVRSIGRFSSLEDIQSLVISASGRQTQLKDVATIVETDKETETILRLNGQDTVGLSITKQSDANAIATADKVRAALATIQPTLPDGMKLTVVTDDTEFTRASVNSVQTDLLLAVFITGLVLLFFLHLLRSTIIVLLAVPTSLISTLLVMWILGFTLNMLTLLALALTIGILVDDSIVVLENIFRHLSLGEGPKEAALNGRNEIGLAAIAITLTDVVVYLPVAFMSGIIGSFFREYGITIAVATLFSLMVSFTLTPMVASMWLKRETAQPRGLWGKFVSAWERGYDGLANRFAGVLSWSLHHRPLVIVVAVLALVGAVAFIPMRLLGVEFAPNSDDGTFTADIVMPAGTSLLATDGAVRQFEDILKTYPEVDKVLAQVGSSSSSIFTSSGSGASGASVTVKLVGLKQRRRSVFQIIDDVRNAAKSIPDANIQLATSGLVGGGSTAALQVQIRGSDMNTLIDLSQQVEATMLTVPGAIDVRNLEAERSPEWQINLDRQRMKDLGISSAEVGSALRTALSGVQISTLQRVNQPELDLTLVANEEARQQAEEMARLPLKFTKSGVPIMLGQIGQLVKSDAPAQINRYNRERTLTVTGGVMGRSSGDVATDVTTAVRKAIPIPAGYRVELVGQAEEQQSSFASMISALGLSIVLIYMLMVALYESFMQPLAIMFSLPVAMVGAFVGLLVTGNTLNIFSMLGIIMLMGLVTKNAILLVDFTDILRKRGMPRHEALVEAGRLRLRPILMTTSALVFAMIPFVLKLEAGAETRAPLAAVVIGGTISSTLLTLVLVPTMYTYLDSLEAFIRRKVLRQSSRFVAQPAVHGIEQQPDVQDAVDGRAPQYGYGNAGK
jgi:hydrophobic/amphiphilic exporter-1 (mainly G- bacteria), HAE1 family